MGLRGAAGDITEFLVALRAQLVPLAAGFTSSAASDTDDVGDAMSHVVGIDELGDAPP